MLKPAFSLAFLALSLSACAATAPKPKFCPLGNMTEINTSGNQADRLAMQMAAQGTLKNGYDKFSIVRQGGDEKSYKMLVRMFRQQDNTAIYETLLPGDVLSVMPPENNGPSHT